MQKFIFKILTFSNYKFLYFHSQVSNTINHSNSNVTNQFSIIIFPINSTLKKIKDFEAELSQIQIEYFSLKYSQNELNFEIIECKYS
jgi:hypothetical protein